MSERLSEAWSKWAERALDPRSTFSQRTSMRTAFMSGAACALREVVWGATDDAQRTMDAGKIADNLLQLFEELASWQQLLAEEEHARQTGAGPGAGRIIRG